MPREPNRRSPVRRWPKWLGVALVALLASVWAAEQFVSANYVFARSAIWLAWGQIHIIWPTTPDAGFPITQKGWHTAREWYTRTVWRPRWERMAKGVVVSIPLWIPIVLVAVPTAYLFWHDRRHPTSGHCRNCGYNLTANTSGVCPECGTAIPDGQRAASIEQDAIDGTKTVENPADRQDPTHPLG